MHQFYHFRVKTTNKSARKLEPLFQVPGRTTIRFQPITVQSEKRLMNNVAFLQDAQNLNDWKY